jgi:hypothetical protein
MLEIIRSGNAQWPFVKNVERSCSPPERKEATEEPLLRAPGIPKRMGNPRIKAVSRAATAPVEGTEKRVSAEFEPFDGPSLFSGFKRSPTMNEPLQPAASRPSHSSTSEQQHGLPVCGDPTPNTTHLYMAWQSPGNSSTFPPSSSTPSKPKCPNCTVLMQSMDRLRRLQPVKGLLNTKPSPSSLPRVQPAASRKVAEIEQPGVERHRRTGCQPPLSRSPLQLVNPTRLNDSLFTSGGGFERGSQATGKAYLTSTGSTNPLASTACAIVKREAEIPALRDPLDFSNPNSFAKFKPTQRRAGVPAANLQQSISTFPNADTPTVTRTTIPLPSTQATRHPADVPRAIPSALHALPNHIPPPNTFGYSSTVDPSVDPSTLPAKIYPENAALWKELWELQAAMKELLSTREEGAKH